MGDSHLADRVPRITRAFVVTRRDLWPWLRIPLAPHLKSIAEEQIVSSVIVGFIPTPPGRAALEQAIKEARMRSVRLVVVNSMMGKDRESEAEFFDAAEALDELESRLSATGVDFDVHRYVRGRSPSEDLIKRPRSSMGNSS